MRRFEDADGRPWDAVVGRESWGAMVVLFVPAGSDAGEPVRQVLLEASSYESAQAELAAMDDTELRALFEGSESKRS